MLGGTASQVEIYAAAQTVAIVPEIFAMSFSSLLLLTLSRLISAGNVIEAKNISSDGMRCYRAYLYP